MDVMDGNNIMREKHMTTEVHDGWSIRPKESTDDPKTEDHQILWSEAMNAGGKQDCAGVNPAVETQGRDKRETIGRAVSPVPFCPDMFLWQGCEMRCSGADDAGTATKKQQHRVRGPIGQALPRHPGPPLPSFDLLMPCGVPNSRYHLVPWHPSMHPSMHPYQSTTYKHGPALF
jgi:hypothetical protein